MISPPSPSAKPLSSTPVHDADAESELAFLSTRSKSEIVDMLRKHTYLDELAQSRRLTCSSSATPCHYHVSYDDGVSTQRDQNYLYHGHTVEEEDSGLVPLNNNNKI
ncbi:hypothetical protein QJS10_CPB19g01344 [Acorus calamus]|uniref:Uncharacterized protein n=1 Tax=Acorus calamus TaxID=4465 RepID=A0AAV9CJT1_ACOCL|nr:hypothetical protein QJS10_CPB19g01344 [Acorus calamus]